MKKNKIIFSILFLCIVSLLILTGCTSKDNSNGDIKEKAMKELDYLDTQIVNMLNKLNNLSVQNYTITSEEVSLGEENAGSSPSEGSSGGSGASQSSETRESQSKESSSKTQSGNESGKSKITTTQMEPKAVLESNENDIDWKSMKSEIEIVNNSWGIVLLDLTSLNVDNNDILSFSSTLDDTILSIKDEKKVDSLKNLAKLYSLIPKYEAGISAPNNIQNIKKVKSFLINAYSFVEEGNWSEVETNASEAEKTFKNLVNDMEYVKNKEHKVNRTYVLIKELQNSLSYKDKKLFYVKYKNLLENINTL